MISSYAPIVLFVYNRSKHTQQTVEALLNNPEAKDSDLIIYSDEAKNDVVKENVDEVRSYLPTITGFQSIRIVQRKLNMGLANSIISGVTEVVNTYGRVIVLEDDLVVSPFFLKYMNDALELYEEEKKVISVHGYAFPIEGLPESYFIKGASCWGWATWKRAWDLFEPDGKKLLQELKKKNLLLRFDINGNYPYKKMLKDQIQGKNNSWAVRWYASALLQDKLTLHPGRSLVFNIGVDGSGEHCDSHKEFDVSLALSPVNIENVVVENDAVLRSWGKYLRAVRIKRIASKIFFLFRFKK